jgi:hypothetical protein
MAARSRPRPLTCSSSLGGRRTRGSGWSRAEAALLRAQGHEFGPEQKQLLIGRTLEAGGDAISPSQSRATAHGTWWTQRFGSAGLFDVVVSAEDAQRPKPAPDLNLAACGVPPIPDTMLDVHMTFTSLTHDVLVSWANSCIRCA